MASKRTLPHTVKLFNYIGEVDDVAEYQESIIHFCYCTWAEGASSYASPSDSAKLYVFDMNSVVTSTGGTRRTFVPPEEWSDCCCGKATHYTFSDNGNFHGRSSFKIFDSSIVTSFLRICKPFCTGGA
mgnify:CR=1 FL=1